MRAADQLIQTLAELGTKHIFSLSGNQIMPIYDAWIDSDIHLLHTRHEAGAVSMADAWGRLTGTPGVALIAGGPGFANGLSAMYVAKMAESPMVIITGHAALSQLGRGAFQEMPQAEMARAVTKASWTVTEASAIASALRQAFAIAQQGRPGPVHVSLPFDLLSAEVPEAAGQAVPEDIPIAQNITPTFVDVMVDEIQQAQRPLVLVGPAVMRSDAYQAATPILKAANVPLIATESPRGMNDPALGAFGEVLAEADLIVLVGKKLDFTLRFGKAPFIKRGARLIQIDADADVLAQTSRNTPSLEIVSLAYADPVSGLSRLADAIAGESFDATWSAEVTAALEYVPPAWAAMQSADGEALYSAEVGRVIHNYLAEAEDSVLVSDGGEFGQWMQALIKPSHRVINGMSGSIGNAIPFGLAARLAFPNSRIIVCTGDGAFGFQPFEMETAARYQLPFTTVIGNDARWNAEYQIQLRNYGTERTQGVELNPTAYHAVVSALGGWGATVTNVDELRQGLIDAEASNQPACLNVTIRGEAAPVIRRP